MSFKLFVRIGVVSLALIFLFLSFVNFENEADSNSKKALNIKEEKPLNSIHSESNVVPSVKNSSFNTPTNAVEIPVLMYHHFDKEIQSGTIADPTVFHEQMKILKRAGYTTVTEEDVIADYEGKKKLPKKPIMITLDDGYASNYEYVFPILKELNMKATIFIITDFIENPQNHPSQYPKLTWDQIREMSDSGLVSFQSHTDNRHSRGINGINTADAEYEKQFLADLLKSKRILEERLGKPVTAFSYPNGEYSEVSEQIVKKAGFEMSFTTEPGLFDTSKHTLYGVNRINIHGNASAESILQTIDKVKL